MSIIHFANLFSVGVFGMVLSAEFCDIRWTRRKQLIMASGMAAILMFQGIIYFAVDADLAEYIYPLITHLPLTSVLCLLNQRILWPAISVLTAYLCCQPRRWLALLIVALCGSRPLLQDVVELLLTVPMILFLIHFSARQMRTLSHYPWQEQCQFGMVPALYYCFDYATRVYTNLLLDGRLVVTEFMPFVCSAAYLIFLYQTSEAGRIRDRLEQTRDSLNLQMTQAVREIEALREIQRNTRAHRHDMRHHMLYILTCIENEKNEQARDYIRGICSEIDAVIVVPFCKNESVNLIFSAFADRIKTHDIEFHISAEIPQMIPIAENDLCVLLSNALENAIHACLLVKKNGLPAKIEVSAYESAGILFLQIVNSCRDDILFRHGIPVTNDPGHGIGVHSICAIVKQYGGMYAFSARDRQFILRVSL